MMHVQATYFYPKCKYLLAYSHLKVYKHNEHMCCTNVTINLLYYTSVMVHRELNVIRKMTIYMPEITAIKCAF